MVAVADLAEGCKQSVSTWRFHVGRLTEQAVRPLAEPGVERLLEVEQLLPRPANPFAGREPVLFGQGRKAVSLGEAEDPGVKEPVQELEPTISLVGDDFGAAERPVRKDIDARPAVPR
jgi:hypothetical protein